MNPAVLLSSLALFLSVFGGGAAYGAGPGKGGLALPDGQAASRYFTYEYDAPAERLLVTKLNPEAKSLGIDGKCYNASPKKFALSPIKRRAFNVTVYAGLGCSRNKGYAFLEKGAVECGGGSCAYTEGAGVDVNGELTVRPFRCELEATPVVVPLPEIPAGGHAAASADNRIYAPVTLLLKAGPGKPIDAEEAEKKYRIVAEVTAPGGGAPTRFAAAFAGGIGGAPGCGADSVLSGGAKEAQACSSGDVWMAKFTPTVPGEYKVVWSAQGLALPQNVDLTVSVSSALRSEAIDADDSFYKRGILKMRAQADKGTGGTFVFSRGGSFYTMGMGQNAQLFEQITQNLPFGEEKCSVYEYARYAGTIVNAVAVDPGSDAALRDPVYVYRLRNFFEYAQSQGVALYYLLPDGTAQSYKRAFNLFEYLPAVIWRTSAEAAAEIRKFAPMAQSSYCASGVDPADMNALISAYGGGMQCVDLVSAASGRPWDALMPAELANATALTQALEKQTACLLAASPGKAPAVSSCGASCIRIAKGGMSAEIVYAEADAQQITYRPKKADEDGCHVAGPPPAMSKGEMAEGDTCTTNCPVLNVPAPDAVVCSPTADQKKCNKNAGETCDDADGCLCPVGAEAANGAACAPAPDGTADAAFTDCKVDKLTGDLDPPEQPGCKCPQGTGLAAKPPVNKSCSGGSASVITDNDVVFCAVEPTGVLKSVDQTGCVCPASTTLKGQKPVKGSCAAELKECAVLDNQALNGEPTDECICPASTALTGQKPIKGSCASPASPPACSPTTKDQNMCNKKVGEICDDADGCVCPDRVKVSSGKRCPTICTIDKATGNINPTNQTDCICPEETYFFGKYPSGVSCNWICSINGDTGNLDPAGQTGCTCPEGTKLAGRIPPDNGACNADIAGSNPGAPTLCNVDKVTGKLTSENQTGCVCPASTALKGASPVQGYCSPPIGPLPSDCTVDSAQTLTGQNAPGCLCPPETGRARQSPIGNSCAGAPTPTGSAAGTAAKAFLEARLRRRFQSSEYLCG